MDATAVQRRVVLHDEHFIRFSSKGKRATDWHEEAKENDEHPGCERSQTVPGSGRRGPEVSKKHATTYNGKYKAESLVKPSRGQ